MLRVCVLMCSCALWSACGRDTIDLQSAQDTTTGLDSTPPPDDVPVIPVPDDSSDDTPPVKDASSDAHWMDAGPDFHSPDPIPTFDGGSDLDLPACLPELECPLEFPFCDLSRSLCVECYSSHHCPEGKFCSPQLGRCLEGCDSDRDCAFDKPQCYERRCVECMFHNDCFGLYGPSRSVCFAHECRSCMDNRDCPDRLICVGGACLFEDPPFPPPQLDGGPG